MTYPLAIESLTEADLILTPNRRLAAWLSRDYNQLQRNKNRSAWPGLQAYPLDSWINHLLKARPITILSDHQSLRLWQDLLEADGHAGHDVDGMALLCHQARALVVRWQLDEANWHTGETPENQLFGRNYKNYQHKLLESQWIDNSTKFEFVTDSPLPKSLQQRRIFLHGFNDENEPLLLKVKAWLEQNGNQVFFSQAEAKKGTCRLISFPQVTDQFHNALLWALERYQHNSQQRIAVVVPNLQNQRVRLANIAEDIFRANTELGSSWQSVINITAGQPLSQYPIVAHLLLALRLVNQGGSLAEWRIALMSPFFLGGMSETVIRDGFFRYLNQRNFKQFTIKTLADQWLKYATQKNSNNGELIDQLSHLSFSGSRQFTSDWLRHLQQSLTKVGWSMERALDSEEYQVVARFYETIQSLKELNLVAEKGSGTQFLKDLNRLLTNTVFQPQTETAPIQVMGILEAAGMNFDALWLCECESINWPQPPTANPMLPKATLKKHNMPGSGAERELTYATALLSGFKNAAEQVKFSWGQFENDTQHMLTPLLQNVEPESWQTNRLQFQTAETRQFDKLSPCISDAGTDEQGLPLEETSIAGGSGLLQAQSVCPFRAYGRYRLQLREDETLYEGVRPADRGSVLHTALEGFWLQVQNYDTLQNLISQPDQLNQIITQVTAEAIQNFRQKSQLYPTKLYQLEQERTQAILKRWIMSCEAARLPFSIDRIEKQQTLTLNDLTLELQVDRIDCLEDGSKIIIDYKTGLKNILSTEGDRPEEPQLPLYALLNPDQTKGIFFGIVRNDKLDWSGLQSANIQFKTKPGRAVRVPEQGWETQVEEWKSILSQLAADFRAGVATVDPVNTQVCSRCHLGAVCRVKEAVNVAQ